VVGNLVKTQDHTVCQQQSALLRHMGADGMSSDESETEEAGAIVLRRKKPRWRSSTLQGMLETIRQQMPKLKSVMNLYSDQGESDCIHPPPQGLPPTCYDEEYKAGLSVDELGNLLLVNQSKDFLQCN